MAPPCSLCMTPSGDQTMWATRQAPMERAWRRLSWQGSHGQSNRRKQRSGQQEQSCKGCWTPEASCPIAPAAVVKRRQHCLHGSGRRCRHAQQTACPRRGGRGGARSGAQPLAAASGVYVHRVGAPAGHARRHQACEGSVEVAEAPQGIPATAVAPPAPCVGAAGALLPPGTAAGPARPAGAASMLPLSHSLGAFLSIPVAGPRGEPRLPPLAGGECTGRAGSGRHGTPKPPALHTARALKHPTHWFTSHLQAAQEVLLADTAISKPPLEE